MQESDQSSNIPSLRATSPQVPPAWALWERRLITAMNAAAVAFVERYTRPDGTLIWRDDWPGMDGSDDAYESFYTFPLFYALGGSDEVHHLARKEWDAITWQWTEYGQVYREFDAYYDWMHHGESNLYHYFFGLADPYAFKEHQRAANFAGFYMGEDPDVPNYDSERRLIRSPLNGSRGPRLEVTAEDWSTHRDVLRHYPTPFEDLPGIAPGEHPEWNDDALFALILEKFNQRLAKGDVPLNLTATTQATHAYLYGAEEKYRRWVLDYLAAWTERTQRNGGIIPDNVGLNDVIGEYNDGKWWGGYYGYRWPHGVMNLLESVVIAGINATLLTGDTAHLDLARSQIDHLWSLRRDIEGEWRVPHKHHDAGWADFRPPSPSLPIHLWNISQSNEDLERVLRCAKGAQWTHEFSVNGMGWSPGGGWFRYLSGEEPDYPTRILEATYAECQRRLTAIRDDAADPKSLYVHHWQNLNPVLCDALVQLLTGAPYPIYHGGLLHCRAFYFDPERRRPGLPEDVAALIPSLSPEGFRLELINLAPESARRVIVQAGAFGEHRFVSACAEGMDAPLPIGGKWLEVRLEPGAGITLDLTVERFTGTPCYAFPWEAPEKTVAPIRPRTPNVDPGALLFFPDWE